MHGIQAGISLEIYTIHYADRHPQYLHMASTLVQLSLKQQHARGIIELHWRTATKRDVGWTDQLASPKEVRLHLQVEQTLTAVSNDRLWRYWLSDKKWVIPLRSRRHLL